MAAIRGHFRRGTDPYFFFFCYQLAIYQVSCFYHKMHDSSQNCYISAPLLLYPLVNSIDSIKPDIALSLSLANIPVTVCLIRYPSFS